jgi:hypothetical protein
MQDADTNIRLTFKDGGWVLLLLLVVILAIIAWAVAPAVLRLGNQGVGDGSSIASYAFDMSNAQLASETTIPVMQHRDMSPVLHNPEIYDVAALAESNSGPRNKFIVSKDLVVGVTINGESRAYPLHVLNVHEIVNDTLGDTPITVYWNWPSGHIAVFERTIEGSEVQFGISGISGNGSMLLYVDSGEVGGEQLWSAMQSESVTGAPLPLTEVTHEVTSWAHWVERNPETTALAPDEQYKKRYRKGDPRTYFLNDTIYFPVSPMPADDVHPKTAVVVLPTTNGFTAFPIDSLFSTANEDGFATRSLQGDTVTFEVSNSPHYAVARDEEGNVLPSTRALWFTWFANHPETVLVSE